MKLTRIAKVEQTVQEHGHGDRRITYTGDNGVRYNSKEISAEIGIGTQTFWGRIQKFGVGSPAVCLNGLSKQETATWVALREMYELPIQREDDDLGDVLITRSGKKIASGLFEDKVPTPEASTANKVRSVVGVKQILNKYVRQESEKDILLMIEFNKKMVAKGFLPAWAIKRMFK